MEEIDCEREDLIWYCATIIAIFVAMVTDNDCAMRIYTLKNPIDNSIFWVGKSFVPIKHRLYNHVADARSSKIRKWVNKEKNDLIREILNHGLYPIAEEIEIIENRIEWPETEKYWIRQFICWGFPLLNIRDK